MISGETDQIGKGSYSNSDLPKNVKVGKYSSIAEECYFHDGDDHLCIIDKNVVYTGNYNQPNNTKKINIGNDVWIGRGVKVVQAVDIGDGSIIGAWSVVTTDVPPYSIVTGNPARLRKFRFDKATRDKLMEISWWHWSEKKLDEKRPLLSDVTILISDYDRGIL